MIAPPKCKNGLCFTAKEKADVLMDTFFSGKQLNEKDFDQNFEQMTNQQIELFRQLGQKQEQDSLWYIEDDEMHELANVFNKLHNTTSFDKNNFHPKMIVSSGPNFRIYLVSLFSSCLTNGQWPWTEFVFFLIKNHLNQTILNPLQIDPLHEQSYW